MENPLGFFDQAPDDVVPHRKIAGKVVTVSSMADSLSRLLRYNRDSLEVMRLAKQRQNVLFGKPVPVSTDQAERTAKIRIPDDDEEFAVPKYKGTVSFINSSEPEDDASKRIEILNEIDIDPDEVSAVRERIAELSETTKNVIINQCIASFMAFDNASSMATTIMRDGLGVAVEVDAGVTVALDQVTTLSLISNFLKSISLDSDIKTLYMSELAKSMALEYVTKAKQKGMSEQYSSILKHLVGRKSAKQTESQADNVDATNNPMGAIRKLSGSSTRQKK